jgi:hypothetical protein
LELSSYSFLCIHEDTGMLNLFCIFLWRNWHTVLNVFLVVLVGGNEAGPSLGPELGCGWYWRNFRIQIWENHWLRRIPSSLLGINTRRHVRRTGLWRKDRCLIRNRPTRGLTWYRHLTAIRTVAFTHYRVYMYTYYWWLGLVLLAFISLGLLYNWINPNFNPVNMNLYATLLIYVYIYIYVHMCAK